MAKRRPRTRSLILAGAVAALGALIVVGTGLSQTTLPAVALASEPLYAARQGDKPAMALALSVEYPTVGAQYVSGVRSATDDATYSNLKEYIGYYDAESCYRYVDQPTETPTGSLTKADYKRFERTGKATNRMCSDAFSGNFLNWASNSAIDMLRLALSGGDRYIDTADLTLLQRAVIPDGDPTCMWNSTNFPGKKLTRQSGTYWGAVPRAMASAAGNNDIWVANTLNRIYFGTSKTSNCKEKKNYTLGATSSTVPGTIGPISERQPGSYSSSSFGGKQCASEGGTCSFSGTKEVLYGTSGGNGGWVIFPAIGPISCSNGAIGEDPAYGLGKKCYVRDYRGSWTPGSTGKLNSDGFFYARVRVCESDASGKLLDERDYKLCTRYPSGKFKPTGTIQKYSDQLRLAAFGYVMDQTASWDNGRYGGVLRAPMKYVGNKTFDIAGQENTPSGGNTRREWDPQTGVFVPNPESASQGVSGVINYLNQFGRTGPTAGVYKQYDPVGELYYEALRYLQGLQPSPDAVSNLTTKMYDGFPLYTSWTDPYGDGRTASGNYSCLKSNIVVIGDVNTHDNKDTRWPTASDANNIPNIVDWTNTVAAFEKGESASYVDGAGVTRTTSNPNTANPSPPSDKQASRIIGAAYWAHTHDIRGTAWTSEPDKQRPGLRVNTILFDVNEYAYESDADKRRNRNQFFTAAKYGGFNTVNGPDISPQSFNTFGNPFRRDDGTVDNNVWQKPDEPGEAAAYYQQSGARGVLSAFERIFQLASTQARSIAGGATQSTLMQSGDRIYQGAFDTKDWSGDLIATAININSGTGGDESVSLATAWSASAQLSALGAPATDRKIVIGKAGRAPATTATAFTWDQIDETVKAALNGADGLGQRRLDYVRGDTSDDGGEFRNRNGKLLGDIVNSGPVYSGAPGSTVNSSTYAAFVTANKNRTHAVFVGANDGMLHAFNADDGSELFGYIPSWLAPKLAALTNVEYMKSHQSYVDATPVVAEAQLGTSWKTVLVSGTGAGGRGVFALDVTAPSDFGADKVLWEFTPASDGDIGYVIGQPRIVKLRTSAPDATNATYKWFAMVAGGVNNYVDSGGLPHSTTGEPALFLLDLAKPAGTAWALGSNYYKIKLPIDATAGLAPGLAGFEVVLGGNQEVTKVYAGDLHGNVWKLDFEKAGSTEWNLGSLSAFGNSSQPLPFFIAKDADGKRQPVTSPPKPVRGAGGRSIYVAIGTGKYLESPDRGTTGKDSFYLVYDPNDGSLDDASGTAAISSRGLLQKGDADLAAGTVSFDPFVWGLPSGASDTSVRAGWYFDLESTGERQVSPIQVLGNRLQFSTLSPSTTGSTDVCGGTSGNSWAYDVSIDTGDGRRRVSTVGLLGAPLIIETANSIDVSKSDSTGRRIRTSKVYSIQQGSGGASLGSPETVRTVVGRLSWRQINNYLDLKK